MTPYLARNAQKAPTCAHVAVVHERYIEAILDGRKTIEARLMQTHREPLGCVSIGDVLHFRTKGEYRARATVAKVEEFSGLTPEGIETLRSRFDERVMADAAFWSGKRESRFAVMISFTRVVPTDQGPVISGMFGAGWKTIGAQNRGDVG